MAVINIFVNRSREKQFVFGKERKQFAILLRVGVTCF